MPEYNYGTAGGTRTWVMVTGGMSGLGPTDSTNYQSVWDNAYQDNVVPVPEAYGSQPENQKFEGLGTDYEEIATVTLGLVPSSGDIAQYVDANSESLLLVVSGADTTQSVDANTEILALTPLTAQEGIETSDAATERLALSASGTETEQMQDSNTKNLVLAPSATDTLQATESASELLMLVPSVVENEQGTDANTETLSLVASGVDTGQFVDVTTERIALSPSSTDIQDIHDSEVVKLYFTSIDAGVEDNFSGPIFHNRLVENGPFGGTRSFVNGKLHINLVGDDTYEIYLDNGVSIDFTEAEIILKIDSVLFGSANDAVQLIINGGGASFLKAVVSKDVFDDTVIDVDIYGDDGIVHAGGRADTVPSPFWIKIKHESDTLSVKYSTDGILYSTITSLSSIRWIMRSSVFFGAYSTLGSILTDFDFFKYIPQSLVETTQFGDIASVTLGLVPSSSEIYEGGGTEFLDSNVVTIRTVPTSEDIAQFIDQAAERLALTALSMEIFGSIQDETGTEYLHLTPSARELYKIYDLIAWIGGSRWFARMEELKYSASILFRRWWSSVD